MGTSLPRTLDRSNARSLLDSPVYERRVISLRYARNSNSYELREIKIIEESSMEEICV